MQTMWRAAAAKRRTGRALPALHVRPGFRVLLRRSGKCEAWNWPWAPFGYWPLLNSRVGWRGWNGLRLQTRTGPPPPHRGPEDHQARHDEPRIAAPVRTGISGAWPTATSGHRSNL